MPSAYPTFSKIRELPYARDQHQAVGFPIPLRRDIGRAVTETYSCTDFEKY